MGFGCDMQGLITYQQLPEQHHVSTLERFIVTPRLRDVGKTFKVPFVKVVVEIMSDGGNQFKKTVFPLIKKCVLFSNRGEWHSQVLNVTLVRSQDWLAAVKFKLNDIKCPDVFARKARASCTHQGHQHLILSPSLVMPPVKEARDQNRRYGASDDCNYRQPIGPIHGL